MPRKGPSHHQRQTTTSYTSADGGPIPSSAVSSGRASVWIRRLDTAAFAAILLTVAMRPLLSETFDSALHSFDRALPQAGSLGPATTVVLDHILWWAMLILLGTATALRLHAGRTGLEMGAALMVMGAAISCFVAGNKRLALNGSFTWLTAITLALVLSRIRTDRFRRSLLIAMLAASGLTSAAKCWMQVQSEFPDTRQQYLEQREQFWAKQHIPLDDPRVELYERRVHAGEATGFLAHPNGQGAYLVMAFFAALAAAAMARDKRCRWGLIGLAAILLLTIPITEARAAMLAAILGLLILVASCRWWQVIARHRWRCLQGFWLVAMMGVAIIVAIGWRTGRLPEPSLEYRWGYWRITTRMIADHLWTGVGALNFDRIYLQYKPIEYPEEVNDPHNFVLSLTAQWGIFGGMGVLAAILLTSITVARKWDTLVREPTLSAEQQPNAPPLRRWLIGTAVGFLLMRIVLFGDLWLHGTTGDRAFAYFDLVCYGLIWIATFSMVLLLQNGTGSRPPAPEGRWAFSPALAALVGALVFLLINIVDFAIFLPGIAMPFAVLTSLLLMPSTAVAEGSAPKYRSSGWMVLLLVAYGVVAHGFLAVRPVAMAAMDIHKARSSLASTAERVYQQAMESDPLDPTPAEELADLFAQRGTPEELTQALRAVDIAIIRDPYKLAFWQTRAGLFVTLHHMTGQLGYLQSAIVALNTATLRYPSSPEVHLDLARLWEMAHEEGMSDAQSRAVEQYQQALSLDAARPGGAKEVRRWSPTRRERIEQELRQIEPTTSSAASP